jgi:hypothetical protein
MADDSGIARLSVESSDSQVTSIYDAFRRFAKFDLQGARASSSLRRTGSCLCPLMRRNCFSATKRPGSNPTLALIAGMPAFHIEANSFHDGEGRLDHIRAGQRQAQLWQNMQSMNGECFLQSLGQTAGSARIEMHEFVMQSVQHLPGGSVVLERVGRVQLPGHRRLTGIVF